MSKFLKRATEEEEPDQEGSNEELYEKLFPKIGRDFVYKEDLENMLGAIMQILDPLGLNPISLNNSKAKEKAIEYKKFLESGKDGSKKYKDLIKLNEDDEEG